MSAAAAEAAAPTAPKGKKKLIVIVAMVLLLALGGGGALFMMKKQAAAAAADEEGGGEVAHTAAAKTHKAPPTFVPLDPFVVNLADHDGERYAQVGLTLEVDDPKFGDEMKNYMPAVRNAILMILAHKTSQQLLGREGKEALAEEIMREAVRPMGIEIDPPEAGDKPARRGHGADDEAPGKKPGKPKQSKQSKKHEVHNPVQRVHFASFIIQ